MSVSYRGNEYSSVRELYRQILSGSIRDAVPTIVPGNPDELERMSRNAAVAVCSRLKRGMTIDEAINERLLVKRNYLDVDYIKTFANEHGYDWRQISRFRSIFAMGADQACLMFDKIVQSQK